MNSKMNTSARLLLATVLLLMPIGWLHAQENKHAQAMHTVFIETINGKFPKDITSKLKSFNEDSPTAESGEWECLDGGGLVPKEKIHVVTLSKSKSNVTAAIGPLYIDGHRFRFKRVPDDPVLPLRPILDAFDKQASSANSYYSYVAGDEQAAFPGISIVWGEQGESFPLQLHPHMNVRIIGFKDDDGFRSTYLLTWSSEEVESTEIQHKFYDVNGIQHKFYDIDGIIYEFHCPKMTSAPQVKSYDPDEYYERTNTSLNIALKLMRDLRNNDPQRAAILAADTLEEKEPYAYQRMVHRLYDRPDSTNLNTSYEALLAKIIRMQELSRTANPTEAKAICHTLLKEVNAYPFLLSRRHVDELDRAIQEIIVPDDLKQQIASARSILGTLQNQTAQIDSLSKADQEYLNRNYWTLSHYQPLTLDFLKISRYQRHFGTWYTVDGEHYSGDQHTSYLDVNGDGLKNFQAENTLHGLRPGRYRLSAVVRAAQNDSNHSGIFVFCQAGDKTATNKTYQKEIPADGDLGGNVWFSAVSRIDRRLAQGASKMSDIRQDVNKVTANGGQGYGWNRIYIDDIIVTDGNLTYGVSTRPEITNTHTIGSSAFSACDFIVERVGD